MVAGYRVEEQIGAGGMAVVYRARDERLGRPVALKVLAPSLANDAEFRVRFIREWRAATAVEHPHIIPVYAADEVDGILLPAHGPPDVQPQRDGGPALGAHERRAAVPVGAPPGPRAGG